MITPKVYNFDKIAEAIKKTTGRDASFSNASLCDLVTRKCLDQKCDTCGTKKVDALFEDIGLEMMKKVKYLQWEQKNENYRVR